MEAPPDPTPRVVDRRRMLLAGAAGAAIGATWVTPSVLSLDQAFAATSACTTGSTINWRTGGFTQFQPGKPTLTSVGGWTVGTFGGTVVKFQVTDTNNRLVYGPGGTYPQFATGVQPTTTDNSVTGFFSMLMNNAAFNNQAKLTITFSKRIKALNFRITDLTIGGGAANGYIDRVILTAYNNGTTGTKVPIVATSGGNPTVANNSPAANDVTVTGTAVPNSPATTNSVGISIAGPFDTLVIQYIQNKNVTSANGTYQYVGLTNMSWTC